MPKERPRKKGVEKKSARDGSYGGSPPSGGWEKEKNFYKTQPPPRCSALKRMPRIGPRPSFLHNYGVKKIGKKKRTPGTRKIDKPVYWDM